jgi:hypothetical protein
MPDAMHGGQEWVLEIGWEGRGDPHVISVLLGDIHYKVAYKEYIGQTTLYLDSVFIS